MFDVSTSLNLPDLDLSMKLFVLVGFSTISLSFSCCYPEEVLLLHYILQQKRSCNFILIPQVSTLQIRIQSNFFLLNNKWMKNTFGSHKIDKKEKGKYQDNQDFSPVNEVYKHFQFKTQSLLSKLPHFSCVIDLLLHSQILINYR